MQLHDSSWDLTTDKRNRMAFRSFYGTYQGVATIEDQQHTFEFAHAPRHPGIHIINDSSGHRQTIPEWPIPGL